MNGDIPSLENHEEVLKEQDERIVEVWNELQELKLSYVKLKNRIEKLEAQNATY
jgi:hypothetical protein